MITGIITSLKAPTLLNKVLMQLHFVYLWAKSSITQGERLVNVALSTARDKRDVACA